MGIVWDKLEIVINPQDRRFKQRNNSLRQDTTGVEHNSASLTSSDILTDNKKF